VFTSTSFVSSYFEHNKIYESPGSFWKWSSYAIISAILKDKCYLKNGSSLLFPNLYTLIVAESSGHRKNRPVEFSETLVHSVNNTKILSGRASVQAILDDLHRAESDAKTGKVIKSNSAILFAVELSAAIVADPEGMGILTDIFDFKPNPYKQRLRTGPCFDLDKIVFSMLSASNEEMLRRLFDISVVRGGFLARTLLIVPNEFRKSNSLLEIDHTALEAGKMRLIELLKAISLLNGEFAIEPEARREYEDWYNPFRKSYEKKKEASGIVGRIHTHVLKIAMILAADKLSLSIRKEEMEQAINDCISLLPNYSIFTMAHGKTDLEQAGGIVIADLLAAPLHLLSRKDIIRRHWTNGVNVEMLDKIVINLETAGLLQSIQSKEQGMCIQLTKSCLESLGVVGEKGASAK
jgi:uncharacterized protein DUF3987